MYSLLAEKFSSYGCFARGVNFIPEYFLPFLGLAAFGWVVLILWVFYWKGMALWKAARLKDKWWFIALLLINTLGILEILYIYIWSKRESLKSRREA
ncbi:MAG: DUF5652 family protein [Candidatus Wolfebacteria bacterium]|nr:DUF5652 family protein [Candidatus Wolfebacteria bacterium]